MEYGKIIRIICKTHDQWRKERSLSVGASAVGTIAWLNPYSSPHKLAVKMRQELKGDFDHTQTLAMMRGHAYEQGVADLFSWMTGKVIIGNSAKDIIVRREHLPFLHASLDRIYWLDADGPQHGKVSESNKAVLECKTTRHDVDSNNLPQSWYLQLQTQMGLLGYRHGALAWDQLHKPNGFGFKFFDYNPDLFKAIIAVCDRFWHKSVLDDEPPLSMAETKKLYPVLFANPLQPNRSTCRQWLADILKWSR